MAAVELDPLFMRALALLRSKSKDSTEMLKAMLDEVLGKSTGKFSDSRPGSPAKTLPKSERADLEKKKAAAKRPAEKSSFADALSSADTGIVSKKSKMESDVRQSRIQPRKPVVDEDDDDDVQSVGDDDDDTEEEGTEEKQKRSSGEEDISSYGKSDDKMGSAGDDDEMWLGLACVVCKEIGQSAGNAMIECQECHLLYHQKCHSPPVTDTDPNDPRLVWYCGKCKRTMKKAVTKKPSSLPDMVITSASSSSSASGKESNKDNDSMNLFRRVDPKPSPTSTTSKQQPFGGLANYAANLTNRQSTKSSPTGTSRIITSGTAKPAPITSRSSSTSGMTNRPMVVKNQSIQRSTSQSNAPKTSSFSGPVVSSSAAKAITSSGPSSSTSASKSLPQTSTESAMKRLHMMKKKASSKR